MTDAMTDIPEGFALVPIEPPIELLISMAVRQDHGLGVPGHYDQPLFIDPEGTVYRERPSHAWLMENAIAEMRKVYEEVVGRGFYKPEFAERYRKMAGIE